MRVLFSRTSASAKVRENETLAKISGIIVVQKGNNGNRDLLGR